MEVLDDFASSSIPFKTQIEKEICLEMNANGIVPYSNYLVLT